MCSEYKEGPLSTDISLRRPCDNCTRAFGSICTAGKNMSEAQIQAAKEWTQAHTPQRMDPGEWTRIVNAD